MEVSEIILLVAGGVIFILSFLIPDRSDKKGDRKSTLPMARDEVRTLVTQELGAVKEQIDDAVDEAVTYAMERTERSLERLSNEKIMAINEYSDTVMSEIHRNHEEAMFLYDMLNSKHTNLKDTVSKVAQTVKEAEETVNTFQRLAPEPVILAPVSSQTSASDPNPSVLNPMDVSSPAFIPLKAAFAGAEEEMTVDAVEDKPLSIEDEDVFQALEEISEDSNSNDLILKLYQGGMDFVSIARELGVGVGEVKLVIDLFNSGNHGK